MRDPTRTGLSPDPLGLHSEALGEFVSGEQPVHGLSPGDLAARADAGESGGARWMARKIARAQALEELQPRAANALWASLDHELGLR